MSIRDPTCLRDLFQKGSEHNLRRLVPAGGYVAVGGGEAEGAGGGEELVEVEADGGAGELGDFVFDGEVEVVGAVEEAFEGALVLGEDGGADAGDVVEVNAAEGEVAEVLAGGDLDAAELGEVGLEGPAEEAGEARCGVGPAAMSWSWKARVRSRCSMRSSMVSSKPMTMVAEVRRPASTRARWAAKYCGDGVFEFAVAAAEVFGEDLGAAAGDPADACGFEALGGGGVVEIGVVGEVHELGDGEGVELEAVAVAGADGARRGRSSSRAGGGG